MEWNVMECNGIIIIFIIDLTAQPLVQYAN